jgi:hypothetical protein
MVMLDKNTVKKDLLKSKVMANFSHYIAGNLYYTVEALGGLYQFPVSTVENYSRVSDLVDEPEGDESMDGNFYVLSFDLGTTEFSSKIKGSELSRWIAKAIDQNEFIKVG